MYYVFRYIFNKIFINFFILVRGIQITMVLYLILYAFRPKVGLVSKDGLLLAEPWLAQLVFLYFSLYVTPHIFS